MLLAPKTRFGSSLFVRNGRLTYVVVQAEIVPSYPFFRNSRALIDVSHFSCYPCNGVKVPFLVRTSPNIRGGVEKIIIEVTPAASSMQRNASYAFNLRCLDEIGGCTAVQFLDVQ
jgi:hypothetical protein